MTPLSPTLQAALAALNRDAAVRHSRSILLDAAGGTCCIVTLETGLWRLLDQVTAEHGLAADQLCRQALLHDPEADPALAVGLMLHQAIFGT